MYLFETQRGGDKGAEISHWLIHSSDAFGGRTGPGHSQETESQYGSSVWAAGLEMLPDGSERVHQQETERSNGTSLHLSVLACDIGVLTLTPHPHASSQFTF